MKNLIVGIMSLVFVCLILLTSYTLYGRNARQVELENALSSGMEYALKSLCYEKALRPASNDELTAVFEEVFLTELGGSYDDIEVEVLDCDYEKGLLNLRVTEHYRHINGRLGQVSAKKTAILEQSYEEGDSQTLSVNYYADNELYCSYSVLKGQYICIPVNPYSQRKNFLGWKNMDDNKLYYAEELKAIVAEKNLNFEACYE